MIPPNIPSNSSLDEIEMILLRSDLNNAGVNISDFAMESAEHINVGLGAASLVEECTCPKEYVGLSCQVRRTTLCPLKLFINTMENGHFGMYISMKPSM